MAPKVTPVIDRPVGIVKGRHTGAKERVVNMKLQYPSLSAGKIAKRVGCHRSLADRVLKEFLGPKHSQADVDRYKEDRANLFRSLQLRLLGSITEEEIGKTPLSAKVIATGILYDKERLEGGQSTQNVAILIDAVQAIRDMRKSAPAGTAVIEG